MMLNYRGAYGARLRLAEAAGEGGLYHTVSFDVLLSRRRMPRPAREPPIDPSVFRDKVVFVGTSAAALHDVVVTPLKIRQRPAFSSMRRWLTT